ncbi:unnamed protein product [Calypogeia fissa]
MGSGSQRRFVDWEERFVSHDRGSRVVHYYLRDRQGQQCLAVIGTERSLRHMVYVVCDDFLPVAGLDKSTTSAFKWRARREVVDWLSAFLIRTRSPEAAAISAGSPHNAVHSSTDADSSLSLDGGDGLESGQEECRSRLYENDPRKQCSVSKADIVWVGSAWSCRKRLRHFHSFQRNGITISVQNFVYVMTEEKDRHIAYVEDLFEDKKLRKKLRVRWFHKTSELTCRIPAPVPHTREVFYTTFQQDLSVECVDGVATVLAPEHYDTCVARLPADTTGQVLMCFRQFDSEGIKPFKIQGVKGYWRQPILSLARIAATRENSPQSDQGSEDLEMDEEDSTDLSRRVIRGPRTARCSRRRTGLDNKVISRDSGEGGCDSACTSGEACGNEPGDVKCLSRNVERSLATSHDQGLWRYDVGDHVEVLSEDSGLRGCWFKATVLRRSFRRLKVRYDDVICEDGNGNLEEWVSSCKISGPCKLGVRISGRPCIRPCPAEPTSLVRLNEGEVVDAWWNDGWWEGILCGKGPSGLIHVFIPGELETAILKASEVRASKEWLNGTWAAIPNYPDLVMLFGLSVPQGVKETDHSMRHLGEGSLFVGAGQTTIEERPLSPAKLLRNGKVEGADQSLHVRDWNRCTKGCAVSVKEESTLTTGTECQHEAQNSSSPSATPGTSRSDAPSTPIRLVFRQLPQDSQDDGISSDVKAAPGKLSRVMGSSGSSKAPGIGLKWKADRKRHRQGDSVTSRVDRNAAHSLSDVKECGMDILKEDVNSDGLIGESAPLEDVENLPRWKTGDGEEIVRHKKHRKGNDSSLKALHGTPMGSSLFMGSLPIANLVMSR